MEFLKTHHMKTLGYKMFTIQTRMVRLAIIPGGYPIWIARQPILFY